MKTIQKNYGKRFGYFPERYADGNGTHENWNQPRCPLTGDWTNNGMLPSTTKA